MTIENDAPIPTALPPVIPAAAPEPQRRAGRLFLTVFAFVNFGLYLTVLMPALFSLPYKVGVLAPHDKVFALGLAATIGAVVGIITGPIAGVLSDRTRTRIGRRRPWLIAGIIVLAIGSTIVALAPSLPVLILGWAIASLGGSANAAAITPIVAERVPEAQRGTVGAIVGIATQFAGVVGYVIGGLLTTNLLLLFLVPIILLAVFGVVYMLVVREPLVDLPITTVGDTFRRLLFNPRKHRDFSLIWLGKLLMQLTLAFLTTYQLYFVIGRLGFTAQEAGTKLALVGGIGILVTMTFAVVSGILSDRWKRRKVFIITASVLASIGLALMAFTTGFGLFFAAVMFILGSAGMFGAVDVALASDLVPDRAEAGRWMSIYNLAPTLATALAPVLGAGLLTIGSADSSNYTLLFLTAAIIALGTGITVTFVKGTR